MINPSSASSPISPLSPEEVRHKRIQSFLERSRKLPPLRERITPIDKTSITQKTPKTFSPQYAELQAKLMDIDNQMVRQIAITYGRSISSDNKKRKALETVEKHIEERISESHELFHSMRESIHLVRKELEKINVLQEKLDSLIGVTFQNHADFEKKIHQEYLDQQKIQKKVHDLEGEVFKIKQEIDGLQKGIVSLREESNHLSSSLLEVQKQEASLKKKLEEIKREVQDCKSKNAKFRLILITATVAIAVCTLLMPPVGVAAGEFSVGVVLTGEEFLLTATVGGVLVGSFTVFSEKDKNKRDRASSCKVRSKEEGYSFPPPSDGSVSLASGPIIQGMKISRSAVDISFLRREGHNENTPSLREGNPLQFQKSNRYLIDKEQLEDMMAVNSGVATLFEVANAIITYPIIKAIEFSGQEISRACNSSPFAKEQCQNIKTFYQDSKKLVKKTVSQSIQYVKDVSTKKIQAFCDSSFERTRQCQQVKAFTTNVKEGFHREVIHPLIRLIENRPRDIEEAALDYERRLGVSKARSEQFFRDGLYNMATLGMALVGTKITPTRAKMKMSPSVDISQGGTSSEFFSFVKDSSSIKISEDLIAARINAVAEQKLFFPNMSEIHKFSLQDLNFIWENNNKTLVGVIDNHSIPRFGFHGTSRSSIESIFSSRVSLRDFYVAGYRYPLDPITSLADFNTIRNKSYGYISEKRLPTTNGGTLILDTEHAVSTGTAITHKTILNRPHLINKLGKGFPSLESDSLSHQNFFNLIERDGIGGILRWTEEGELAVSTQFIVNTEEMLLPFNSSNFSSRVKGVLLNEDSFYLPKELKFLHTQDSLSLIYKGVMAERFKNQEVILSTFEKLGVLKELSKVPWKTYHAQGETLINNFPKVTKIPMKRFRQLNCDSFLVKEVNKLFAKHVNLREKIKNPSFKKKIIASENISRRKISGDDIGHICDPTHVNGYVTLNNGTLLFELVTLKHYRDQLDYDLLAKQMILFAKQTGAKKLFLEIKSRDLELAKKFTGVKMVFERTPSRGHLSDYHKYLFEIPLK